MKKAIKLLLKINTKKSIAVSLFFVFTFGLLLAGTAFAAPKRKLKVEEANRALVLEFYDNFFNKHQVDEASKVVAEDYIQHNPNVPDGKEPFVSYFRGYFEENPTSRVRIVRSAADGDLVWLHVYWPSIGDAPASAVLDIFRVKNGMIVEHWDVIQEVPEEAANDNTMF